MGEEKIVGKLENAGYIPVHFLQQMLLPSQLVGCIEV